MNIPKVVKLLKIANELKKLTFFYKDASFLISLDAKSHFLNSPINHTLFPQLAQLAHEEMFKIWISKFNFH